jgi:hypothetical protein
MYNVLHSASSPGASDAFRARPGRGRARLRHRRGRRRVEPVEPVEPVEGGRLVALCEAQVVDDRLDDVLR